MNNEEIQLRAKHWFWHETLRQEDRDYLEPYITAAEYVDDMYVCLLYTSDAADE